MALTQYQKRPVEDLILVTWWVEMMQEEEAHRVLGLANAQLAVFLANMQNVDLYYDLDDDGKIWFASWLDIGVLDGIGMSIWIRESKRRSKKALRNILAVMEQGFCKGNVLVVVTNREEVEAQHHKIGFTPACHIPMIYGGTTARVSYMTVEDFKDVRDHYRARDEQREERVNGRG